MERKEVIELYSSVKLETVYRDSQSSYEVDRVFELTITVGDSVGKVRLSRFEREQLARMFSGE